MKKSYSIFENFIFKHSNKTVKSAFVFQFHPVNVDLPVFLVYLFPWINGKANSQIEQIMFRGGELMNNFFFIIIGYAFDGDSSNRHNLENIDKNFDYSKVGMMDGHGQIPCKNDGPRAVPVPVFARTCP
ncbi:hypothetical protein M9Y10_034307 [Tritrichomonas musculus]|uniref:Uncharacterized protein n=1 Tax=Tritrichomonas musculus TaxID=1915356 RepID=A0ABR2KFA2_9EUKA